MNLVAFLSLFFQLLRIFLFEGNYLDQSHFPQRHTITSDGDTKTLSLIPRIQLWNAFVALELLTENTEHLTANSPPTHSYFCLLSYRCFPSPPQTHYYTSYMLISYETHLWQVLTSKNCCKDQSKYIHDHNL